MLSKSICVSATHNISNRQRASSERTAPAAVITVEAAFALPLFFMACMAFAFMIELQTTQAHLHTALAQAAKKEAASILYMSSPVVNFLSLKSSFQEALSAGSGGSVSIKEAGDSASLLGSYIDSHANTMEVNLSCRLRLPLPLFRLRPIPYADTVRVRLWFGRPPDARAGDLSDDTIVYITERGLVYHQTLSCTYLRLTIQIRPAASLSALRNEWGSRYHPCEFCAFGPAPPRLIITTQGTKYHYRMNCSGLKRIIRSIKKSEVGFRRPCSRCFH